MSFLQTLRGVASIVGAGVDLWVEPPGTDGLTVTLDRGWAERHAAARKEFRRNNPEFAERQRRQTEDFRKRGLLREVPKNLHEYICA